MDKPSNAGPWPSSDITDYSPRPAPYISHCIAGPLHRKRRAVPASSSPPSSLVHGISGWRRLVLWPAGLLLKLWGMTLRFEVDPEDLANYRKRDEPVAFVVWHNRLFLCAEIF